MRIVRVEALNVFPLKSARAIPRTRVTLASTGFEWDRHWMAASPDGVFMSQRTQPRLALVEPEIGADTLTLRAPNQAPLVLPLHAQGETARTKVWKDFIAALDQGDAASAWMSEAVQTTARLYRISPVLDRHASAQYAGNTRSPVSFTDGFPILVVNRASYTDLIGRMPEPVPLDQFRPNLVLEGLEPFEEDRIAAIRIGPVTLRLVKPCTRCVITSTNQKTGEPTANPLPVLRAFRFNRELMGVTFGENAVIDAGVGAAIETNVECEVIHE